MEVAHPCSSRHAPCLALALALALLATGTGLAHEPDKQHPKAGTSSAVTTLPALEVVAAPLAKGKATDGYREDRVSGVGPWQGRNLQETPYSVTVFSEELISNLQAVSADQVFRINPTMQLSRAQFENNQPTAIVRGFTFYAPYRDGVPDDQYGHASTIEDSERIEVLNGLSGFLYGAGNVGGLVNYVTKRSTDERFNELTVSSRGNASWYAHADFGGKFDAGGKFGYRLNLAHQDGDTPIKGQTIKRDVYSLVLDARPRDDLYLQVSTARQDYDDWGVQPTWSATAATRPSARALRNDRSYSPPWAHRYYETKRHAAQVHWDINPSFSLRANLLYSDGVRNAAGSTTTNVFTSRERYVQNFIWQYAPGVTDVLSYQDDARAAVYADWKFHTGAVHHKLTAGFQYSRTHQDRWSVNAPRIDGDAFSIDDRHYAPEPVIAPIARGTRRAWFRSTKRNAVLGDDITFNEQWSVLVGLAHTNIVSRTYDKSSMTPTAALVFKPTPDLSTYVSYMESLEQGGLAADTYNGAPVQNSGKVFKPLKSEQLELGAKYSLSGMLLAAAVFQIDKALQYYDTRQPLRPVFTQDGRQVHKGAEFTAIGKLSRNLSMIGGFTWLDPKIKQQRQNPLLEGKRPIHVADRIFKLRAEYAVPNVAGLSVSGGFNTTSASYADTMNTDRLRGFTVYDLGARYQTGSTRHPLVLRADLSNVTNKHYWANAWTLGEPRTLVVSASYRF